MKRVLSVLALFASTSTLFCCALPALFIALGAGATFAGLVSNVPQLIWLSEHKQVTFGCAGALLLVSVTVRLRGMSVQCPADAELAAACSTTRRAGGLVLWVSLGLFSVGAFFAFAPDLLGWTS